MSNIESLKLEAKADMANNGGEWGAAENKKILVMAKKVGYNKPGRRENIKYKVINK